MIIFSNIYKRYPNGFEAVKNIAFTINQGEMVFITGPSGAGKSTILKLIGAIERPTAGDIIVNHHNVSKLKSRTIPFLRRNIGMVFQDQKILFDRSVFENIILPLQICGLDRQSAIQRVHAALDKVGLLGKEKNLPITLSGGERQRLCIARAVVNRPSILVADEPTAYLDKSDTKDIMNMFESFHNVGVTVLITTPNTDVSTYSQHRILTLNQGELIA
ncbi:MAG: cell division ATP-binding protein FtsE [Nitrosomonadaceae bacterium]|nr:cell division ATP-binding protein FtsE [Nitrosomonadaceae bacterium]|tara:strand:- start:310 stop:963 length:654 start_codon:yes stop_codon:yes gene_type:complete